MNWGTTTFDEAHEAVRRAVPEVERLLLQTAGKRHMVETLVGLRKQAGLSAADIAARAGWDVGTVEGLEDPFSDLPEDRTILARYAEVCAEAGASAASAAAVQHLLSPPGPTPVAGVWPPAPIAEA